MPEKTKNALQVIDTFTGPGIGYSLGLSSAINPDTIGIAEDIRSFSKDSLSMISKQMGTISELQKVVASMPTELFESARQTQAAYDSIKPALEAFHSMKPGLDVIAKNAAFLEQSTYALGAYQNTLMATSIIAPTFDPLPSIIEPEIKEKELDTYLARLNPDFPKMRRGAWQTFHGNSEDKIRQSISSMRELFSNILWILAPKKNREETRISQLKRILHDDTQAEFIEAEAKACDKLYDYSCKIVHTTEKAEKQAVYILERYDLLFNMFRVAQPR